MPASRMETHKTNETCASHATGRSSEAQVRWRVVTAAKNWQKSSETTNSTDLAATVATMINSFLMMAFLHTPRIEESDTIAAPVVVEKWVKCTSPISR